ncbi:unnamed protein product [Pleuronectes platessa]|uniref:Uncharacterized protein n=1 Tax=Pleuronectes platessa TaxID=8262 RepID=A0A9N7YE28_PLEPL|nr:unnamed protein product [Pleuronectes platessa]
MFEPLIFQSPVPAFPRDSPSEHRRSSTASPRLTLSSRGFEALPASQGEDGPARGSGGGKSPKQELMSIIVLVQSSGTETMMFSDRFLKSFLLELDLLHHRLCHFSVFTTLPPQPSEEPIIRRQQSSAAAIF